MQARFTTPGSRYPHIAHHREGGGDDQQFAMYPTDRPPRSRSSSLAASDADTPNRTGQFPPLSRQKLHNLYNDGEKNHSSSGGIVEEPNTNSNTPTCMRGGSHDAHTGTSRAPVNNIINHNTSEASYFNPQTRQYEYNRYGVGGIPFYALNPKNKLLDEGAREGRPRSFSSDDAPPSSSFNKLRSSTRMMLRKKEEDASSLRPKNAEDYPAPEGDTRMSGPRGDGPKNVRVGDHSDRTEDRRQQHMCNGGTLITKASVTKSGTFTTKDGYVVAIPPIPPRHRAASRSDSRAAASASSTSFVGEPNSERQRMSSQPMEPKRAATGREGELGDDDEPVLVTTKTKTTVDPTDLSIVTTNETRIKIPSQAVTNFLMLSNGGRFCKQNTSTNKNNTYNILLSSPASPMITAGPRAKPKNIDPEPDTSAANSKFIASFGQPASVVPAEVARKFPSASSFFPSTLKRTDPIPIAEEEQSRFNVLHRRRVALRPYQNSRHGRAHAQRETIEASRRKKLQDVDTARKAKVARAIGLRGEKVQMKKERDELNNFYLLAFGQPTRVYPFRVASSFPRTCHSKYEQYFTKTWDADLEDITFFVCPQSEEPCEEVRRFEPVYLRRADIQPVETERHEAADRRRGHFLRCRQERILERESKHVKSVKDRGGLAALRDQAQQIAAATEEEKEQRKDEEDNECLSPRSRALFDIHSSAGAHNNNGVLVKSTLTRSTSTSMHTKTTLSHDNYSKNNDEISNIRSNPTDMEQKQENDHKEGKTNPLCKPRASVTEIKKTESFSSSTSTTMTTTTTKKGGEEDTAENSSSRDVMVMSPPPAPRSTSAIIEDEDDVNDYYQNGGNQADHASAVTAEVDEEQQYPSVWTLHGLSAGKNDENNNKNNKGDGLRDSVNPYVNARGFPHTAKRYFSAAPLDAYNRTNKSMPLADEEKMRFTAQDQRREQLARSSEAQDRARDANKRREDLLSERRSVLKRQDLMRKIKTQQAIEGKERSKIVDGEQKDRVPVEENFEADTVEINSRPVASTPNERSQKGDDNERLSPISKEEEQQPQPNTNSPLFLPNHQIVQSSPHVADDGQGLMRSVSSLSASRKTTTPTTMSTTRGEEELGRPTNPTDGAPSQDANRNEVGGGGTDTMNNINEKRAQAKALPQASAASEDSLTPASHSFYCAKKQGEENTSTSTTTTTTQTATASHCQAPTTMPPATTFPGGQQQPQTSPPAVTPQTTTSTSKMPPPPPSPPKSRAERMKAKNAAAPPPSSSTTLPISAATTTPTKDENVFSVPLRITNGRVDAGAIVHEMSSTTTTCTIVTSTKTTSQINRVPKPVLKYVDSSENTRRQYQKQQRPVAYKDDVDDDDDENDYYNPKEIIGVEEAVVRGPDNFPSRQYRQLALRAPTSRPPPHAFISCFSIPKMVTPSKNALHFPNSRAIFSQTCRSTNIAGAAAASSDLNRGSTANRRGGLDIYYNNKNDPMPLAEEEKIRFVPVRIRRMRLPEFDHCLTYDCDEANARRKKFMDARVQKLKEKRARHQAYLYSDEHLRQMGITVMACPAHLFLMDAAHSKTAAAEVNHRQQHSNDGKEVQQQRPYSASAHTVWAFGQPKSVIPAANSRDFPRTRSYFNAAQNPKQNPTNGNPASNSLLSAYNEAEESIPIEAEEMIRFIPLAARRELIAGPADAERANRNAKRKERYLKSLRTSLNNKDRDRKMRAADAKKNPNRPTAGPIDMAQKRPPSPTAAATAGNKKRSSQNASLSSAPQSSASSSFKATAAGASSCKSGGRRGRRLSFVETDDNNCLSPVSPYAQNRFPTARGFAVESSTASEVNIPPQQVNNKIQSLCESGGMGSSTTTALSQVVHRRTESTTTTITKRL